MFLWIVSYVWYIPTQFECFTINYIRIYIDFWNCYVNIIYKSYEEQSMTILGGVKMKKAYGLGALIIFLVFLLLRCSTNKDSIDKEIQQLLILPDEFTSEWAIENDYVMNKLENYSNINVLDEFIKKVNEGIESHVFIINFTDEGDMVLNLLIYDGEQIESYLDTRRDEFGSQTIIKTQGYKIEVSEDDVNEHFIGPHVRKEYYLVGDNMERLLIRVRIK